MFSFPFYLFFFLLTRGFGWNVNASPVVKTFFFLLFLLYFITSLLVEKGMGVPSNPQWMASFGEPAEALHEWVSRERRGV